MRPRPALRLSNAPTPTDDRAARTGTTPTLRRMRTGTNAGDDCGMRSLGDGDGTCDGERSSSGASPIQTSSRLTGRLRTTIPPIFTRGVGGMARDASPGGARFRASARRSIMRREGASRPVSRVLYGGLIAHVAAIRLGRPLLDASRNQPGRLVRKRPGLVRARAAPIRSCSRWGLPCRPRCRVRGGLLPHLFTLTPSALRGRLRLSTDRRWTDDRDEAVCFLWHFP